MLCSLFAAHALSTPVPYLLGHHLGQVGGRLRVVDHQALRAEAHGHVSQHAAQSSVSHPDAKSLLQAASQLHKQPTAGAIAHTNCRCPHLQQEEVVGRRAAGLRVLCLQQ